MFKEIGQFAGLMKNLPKIREEMEKFQQRIGQITAEANTGGGMVTIRVNGHMEVVSCKISDDAMQMNDKEMLEDLIKGAFNQAVQKCRKELAEESSKMASGFGIPPGMNLPGME